MRTILVASLKGGTGKTTVTAGLAKALTRRNYKVGALDADYHAPNLHIMLNCDAKPHRAKNGVIIPPEVDGIKILSWAMIWPQDSAVMIEDIQIDYDDLMHAVTLIKAKKYDAAIKYLIQLAEHPGGASEHVKQLFDPGIIQWGDIDYLVIDTPPESTGTVRVVSECGNPFGVVIVCHPSRVSLADVRRTIDLFRKKQIPIIGMVSNQGTQDGVNRYDMSDSDIAQFAKERGIPFICAIPHTNNTQGYFDKIADFVVSAKPVVLKIEQIDSSKVDSMLKTARSIADLMEVFR